MKFENMRSYHHVRVLRDGYRGWAKLVGKCGKHIETASHYMNRDTRAEAKQDAIEIERILIKENQI